MRIDLLLKYVCLTKSRAQAKSLCDKQRVFLNHRPARASSTVKTGDIITLQMPARQLTIEILSIPRKQLSKSTSPQYYQRLDSDDTANGSIL